VLKLRFSSHIRYIPLTHNFDAHRCKIATLMALMGVVLEIPGGAGTPGA
jgi:hypothetical protein